MMEHAGRAQWATGVALAIALGSTGIAVAAPPGNTAPAQRLAKLDALLAGGTSTTLPGCAIGIQGKGIDVTRAYGLADLERPAPIQVDSVFNIASTSKQFTAAAILVLVAEGKLKLNDDIRTYLPELSNLGTRITIDHLLNHTSGLRDFRFTDWVLGRDTLAQSNLDVLAYAARQQALNHAPGESHLYNNTGYVLLAIIAERASGQSLQALSEARLFGPAGMKHTQWESESPRLVTQRAFGYAVAERSSEGVATRFEQMPTARRTYGHGNLLTTVEDLQLWNAALSRNAFGASVTAQLEETGRLNNGTMLKYGRGEFVDEYRGLRQVHHGGYNGNYTAWVARYPEIGLSVSMVCNSDHDDVHPQRIVDVFLPAGTPEAVAPPAQAAAPTVDLSKHNGVYRRADNGQVTLMAFPAKAGMAGNRYVRGPYSYEFSAEVPGQVTRATYGNVAKWVRLASWQPEPSTMGQYVGRFSSDELLGGFDVALEGKKLTLTVLGLSDITASLEPRATDIFEARGADNLDGLLIAFKRDAAGRIAGLAIAPDSLQELQFDRASGN